MQGELTKLMCHSRSPACCRQSARVLIQNKQKHKQLYCKSSISITFVLASQKQTDGQKLKIIRGGLGSKLGDEKKKKLML